MLSPLASRLTTRPIAAALAALLLAASPVMAQDAGEPPAATDAAPEVEVRFDHYVFIPASPNAVREQGGDLPHRETETRPDPTLIPFSNWQFRGPDGEWQPWRRRGAAYRNLTLRNLDERFQPDDQPRLNLFWQTPAAQDIRWVEPVREGGGRGDFDFVNSTSGNTSRGPGFHQHLHSLSIDDLPAMPTQLEYRLRCSRDDWESVRAIDITTELPAGNDDFSIVYLGAPRPDGRAMGLARGAVNREARGPFTLEVHALPLFNRDEWDYRISYFGDEGELAWRGGVSYLIRGNNYAMSSFEPGEFKYVEVQRMPIHTVAVKPIDLRLLDNLQPDELVLRSIDITLGHRFGEPVRIQLDAQAPGATCLLDLDTVFTAAYPEGEITDDDLAKYLDEHEIDLMLIPRDGGVPYVQPVSCIAYQLDASFWNTTPSVCVAELRANGSKTGIGETVQLVTTCDGSMVLYRIIGGVQGNEHRSAQVTLEVRRLVEP